MSDPVSIFHVCQHSADSTDADPFRATGAFEVVVGHDLRPADSIWRTAVHTDRRETELSVDGVARATSVFQRRIDPDSEPVGMIPYPQTGPVLVFFLLRLIMLILRGLAAKGGVELRQRTVANTQARMRSSSAANGDLVTTGPGPRAITPHVRGGALRLASAQ